MNYAALLRANWHWLVIGLLAVALAWTGWRLHLSNDQSAGKSRTIAEMDARTLSAAKRIQAAAQSMQASADTITKGKNDALASLAADRDDLLEQLRDRPRRPAPGTAEAASDGQAPAVGTGAVLYFEDAEFLSREASRADRGRLSLIACYAQYDAARLQLDNLETTK